MKNIAIAFITLLSYTVVGAQEFSDIDKSPLDVAIFRSSSTNETLARVIYSRPQKNNRKIFGELVTYGEVWRTGANEATEITLYHNMKFGENTVPAGTYSLYTIPGASEWTVILNSAVNEWGAYKYDQKNDIARINVPVKKSAAPIEVFSMTFLEEENGAKLMMGWDTIYIEVPLIKAS